MADEMIALIGMLSGLGMPTLILLVWIVLNYQRRRRFMELHHAERMAAIERGMELPPLPTDMIDGGRKRPHSTLLPGLVWTFVGLAIVIGMALVDGRNAPWFVVLVPLAVGLAYLLYYFIEGRKAAAQPRE